jgi:hypothetical protein
VPARTPSPSGSFELELVEEREESLGRTWRYRRLHVYDRAGTLVYVSPQRFAAWFPLAADWDARDRAWIASADSGTVVFTPGPDGWLRSVYAPDAPVPVMFDAATGGEVPVTADEPPASLEGIVR